MNWQILYSWVWLCVLGKQILRKVDSESHAYVTRRVRVSFEALNTSIMMADMHSFYSAIFLYVDLEVIIWTHKTTEAEVRKTISSFLKYAPDRCGGAGRPIKENNS